MTSFCSCGRPRCHGGRPHTAAYFNKQHPLPKAAATEVAESTAKALRDEGFAVYERRLAHAGHINRRGHISAQWQTRLSEERVRVVIRQRQTRLAKRLVRAEKQAVKRRATCARWGLPVEGVPSGAFMEFPEGEILISPEGTAQQAITYVGRDAVRRFVRDDKGWFASGPFSWLAGSVPSWYRRLYDAGQAVRQGELYFCAAFDAPDEGWARVMIDDARVRPLSRHRVTGEVWISGGGTIMALGRGTRVTAPDHEDVVLPWIGYLHMSEVTD